MARTRHRHDPRTVTLAAIGWLIPIFSMGSPACSNNNATQSPSTTSDASADSSSSSSGGSSGGGSGGSSGSGSGSIAEGGSDSSTDGGTEGGAGDAGPTRCAPDAGPNGCILCPQTNNQILNQCSPSGDQCTPFDNATNLPFWDGGMLPPVH
jgi:hypothetical protein